MRELGKLLLGLAIGAAIVGTIWLWDAMTRWTPAKDFSGDTAWARTVFEMEEVSKAVNAYYLEHDNHYPTALSEVQSSFANPLIDRYSKRPFIYIATSGSYVLFCYGRDQQPGGERAPDRDIVFTERGRLTP